MDSVSQFALGAALGELALGRKLGRRAIIVGGLLGTLPDLDVVVRYADAVASFTFHRSWSHSLIVLSLVSVPLAWLLSRYYPERWLPAKNMPYNREKLTYSQWFIGVWLILFTHPLLDAFTVYGTQIFWPLSVPPTAWGSLFIIDPAYTIPLILALFIAWRSRSQARLAVSTAIIISCLYICWTLVSQRHANKVAIQSLKSQSLAADQVLIAPAPFALLWRIVALDGDHYHEGFYSLLDDDATIRFQSYPNNRAIIQNNKDRWSISRLDWFTQGFIAATTVDDRLIINDLRMGVESSYVFRFDVGPKNLADAPIDDVLLSKLLPVEINISRMRTIARRVIDQSVVVPPAPGAVEFKK